MSRRLLVAVLLGMVITAGCAGIPRTGPVHEVEGDQGLGESTARYIPAGPAPGGTPEQIVSGYLEAMLAYPVSYATASEFLTSEAADGWRPSERTVVYSEPRLSESRAGTEGTAVVASSWKSVADLDRRGHFAAGEGRADFEWHLILEDGQWRITDPPSGTLVTQRHFEDYFRPFDIYFLDGSGTRVVPDPVFRVVGDQLATGLLTSLAQGPDDTIAAEVQSRVPGVERTRRYVPLDSDRVAEVEFTIGLRDLSTEERAQLGAQLAWTLSGAPRVGAVRIVGSDGALAIGGEVRQSTSGFSDYAPAAGDPRVAVVTDGRLRRVDADSQRAIAGVSDIGDAVAVAATSELGAVVDPGRTTMRILGAGDPRTIASEEGFLSPVIDRDGRVWAADAAGVRLVTDDEVEDVAAPDWPPDTTSFAVSPDGARYAVTVGTGGGARVLVGAVVEEEGTRLGAPEPVAMAGVSQMRSIQWVTGTRLAMLADGAAGEQVYSVRIDGSGLTPSLPGLPTLLPRIEPVALATSTDSDPRVYVLDEGGDVRVLTPRGWTKVPVEEVVAIG